MNKNSLLGLIMLVGLALSTSISSAAPQAKTYQVTGPIVEVTDKAITLKTTRKGEEEIWQVARDAGTKVNGDLKVGAKVTIQYRMVATDVEVKADKTAAQPDKAPATEAANLKKTDKK